MKKIISLTIALAMVLTPSLAFGNVSIEKEETVYIITKASGEADDIIVSDHLINDANLSTINDRSDLSDIENVKGDETFTKSGESLAWNASGNDIYYQGTTDKNLPIKPIIKYFINGREETGKSIQGKKGDFKISIDFEKNVDTPFIALAGILVQDENYSNMKIDNGKFFDDGEKTIVAGLAAPGVLDKWNSITISGHTKAFNITDIMAFASNSVFEDVDTGALGDLNYDKQINELNKGSKQLVDGSRELYRGLLKLNKSAPKLADGISQLNAGAAELQAGTLQLKLGVSKLCTGADQLHNGITTMQSQLGAMNIETELSGLAGGLNQLSAGVTTMTEKSNSALDSADAAIAAVASLIDQEKDNISPDAYKAMLQYVAGARQYIAGSKSINDSAPSETLPTGGIKQTVSGTVQQVNSSVSGLSLSPLVSGLSQLEAGSQSLSAGLAQLSGSVGDKTNQKTLVGGAAALAKGMEQLNSQTGTLLGGIQQLTDGSKKVADGMDELYQEGIKKIVDLYNGDLKHIVGEIDDVVKSGKKYNTFTKLGNGMIGSVKFVFKVEVK